MPNLLSRNPFHHHDGDAGLTRNSRSILNFMSRRQSNESMKSDKSSDSLQGHFTHAHEQATATSTASPRPSHSMAELKRFFRPNAHRKGRSPAPAVHHHHAKPSAENHVHTQSAIPPSSDSTLSLSNNVNIYHDDAILVQKYGKMGKLLGAGAGGSVKVLVRPTDNATFAVKEFRPRKSNESVRDYAKKCTAEFCIGSTLRHPNIIETLDIFSDSQQNKYYEVMEYCPVDFFAVIMTGKMSRGEINCCLKQLTEGVKYLHSMGLAHRDLKLDNCVMTSEGILKLIDFGSAVVFRYPMETEVAMAHGVVGSDPYLAPEVLTSTKRYDPQCVDIWSIGIIFCCMMLKRFPWKAPRDSDDNYRLYCMPDDCEHDYAASAKHHEELLKERRERRERERHQTQDQESSKTEESQANEKANVETDDPKSSSDHQQDTSKNDQPKPEEDSQPHSDVADQPTQETNGQPQTEKDDQRQTDEHHDADKIDHHNADEEAPQTSNTKEPEKHVTEKVNSRTHDLKSVASHKSGTGHQKKVIHGHYRLLRLLPHAARPIMSRVLEIDPKKRATLTEMYEDPWFSGIECCTISPTKQVIRAPGHHHTLVREEDAHLETYKV